jgi:uncharacterized protein (TIGR03382 family)
MKSWVKSGARQIASGTRTFAALVLGPIMALQGCAKQEEPQASTTQQVQPLRAEKTAATQGAALSAALAGTYVKTEVPIEWRTFTGTNLALGDDTVTTVTSPFPILYNDNAAGYTSVRVSMNGAISFTSTSISYINAALPASAHATFVVPFWDDLFPGPTSADNVYWGVLGTAPNREFVVEWRNVYHRDARAAANSTLNFQVVFYEGSSDVLFNYKDVIVGSAGHDKGANATVGVQVSTTSAVQHSHNTASLNDNTAYSWTVLTQSAAPVVTVPTISPLVVKEGDPISVDTTFTDPDGAASGPWKLSVDTDYKGASFGPKFFGTAAAEGPISAQGAIRSSGTVNVAVRVEDKGRMRSNVEQVALTVQDVPPALDPLTISAAPREGNPVVLSTAFSDPGLDSPWKVEWDFDYDGTTFNVDASTPAPTVGPVTRTQVFRFDGTFKVAARAVDKDGVASNIQELMVTVADLSPTLTGIAGSQVLPEGATLSLQADFTNPGDNASPWKVQWDFDYDGQNFDVEEEVERNTDGRVELSRFSRDSGRPRYALRIVDADGSISNVQELAMNIEEAYPVLSPVDAVVLSGAGNEPSSLSFSLSAGSGAEEPAADPITGYLWDFNGDGSFDYASASPYALNTYRDNARGGGAYMAKVRVLDEDGYTDAEVPVTINNVPPVLDVPATPVQVDEGNLLALRLSATEPGADALTYSVAGAPEGLSITPDGLVLWTPAFKHTSGGQGKRHTITVTVTDDDGASDSKQLVLSSKWKDSDNDGMADTWEQANGLNPNANDASSDQDGDGVSNMAEFLNANGGPKIPADAVANGPLTGTQVKAAQIVLTTRNVTDAGDLTSVKYQFQLFSDMGLTTKVRDVTVDQEASQNNTTSATLTDGVGDPDLEDLEDDHGYAWRVRATDGAMHGAWSAVQRITFNPSNDAPGAPRASQPMSGTQVSTEKPVLVVDNATDADDSSLTYTFELAENSALTQGAITSAAIAGNPRGSTAWAVTTALKPFTTYYWRVTATDADGATSQSEVASFTVYIGRPSNREPGLPGLPANAPVTSLTPTIEFAAANDADGDSLKYIIEVDSNPSFGSPNRQVSALLEAGQDGKVRFQTTALAENTRYYFRARAMDSYSASDWAVGTFVVNAQNDAPSAPVALNPSDAIIYNKRPTLIVQNGTDPEGDAITYSFEVRNADGAKAASGEGVASGSTGQTSFKLNADLEEGVEYIWTARAKDASGAVSQASAEARFQVYKAPVIPEQKPDEGCSAGAGSLGGLLPLLVMAMGLLGRRRRNG